jgi:hypothetical protein
LLYLRPMEGLSALILAAVLGGAPLTLHAADSWTIPRARLDLGVVTPTARTASAEVESMIARTFYLSPTGWLGVQVDSELALLLDVRVDKVATSPDPARGDPQDAVVARFGVELRPRL